MTLYKALGTDGTAYHGGVGSWPLPVKLSDGSWQPGEWLEVKGGLVPCRNGLHLCDREAQLLEWLGPAIFEAEYEGEVVRGNDKIVVRRARLLKQVESWSGRSARLFACDCAERVLPLFEREYPDDARPRRAIETARAFAEGLASEADLAAARDAVCAAARDAARAAARAAAWAAVCAAAWAAARAAARDAARDAAWAAVCAAAWAAARDAARAAARAAARDAAWAAERTWQAHRLAEYLNEEVTT